MILKKVTCKNCMTKSKLIDYVLVEILNIRKHILSRLLSTIKKNFLELVDVFNSMIENYDEYCNSYIINRVNM